MKRRNRKKTPTSEEAGDVCGRCGGPVVGSTCHWNWYLKCTICAECEAELAGKRKKRGNA